MPKCQFHHIVRLVKDLKQYDDLGGFKEKPVLGRRRRTCFEAQDKALGEIGRFLKSYRKLRTTFWIDVICIPVHNVQLRAQAISNMTPIYAGASRVLVLDSDLMNTVRLGTPMEEICARLVKSAWMGRCWTLQEGALARSLAIQMKDGLFNAIDATIESGERYQRSIKVFGNASDRESLDYYLRPLRAFVGKSGVKPFCETCQKLNSQRDSQFVHVWNLMAGRSTTQMDDIYVIFANLLDFGVTHISSLEPREERLKAMFCAQERLPLDFVLSPSPRLTTNKPLDRWVPRFPGPVAIARPSDIADYARLVAGKGLVIDSNPNLTKMWFSSGNMLQNEVSLATIHGNIQIWILRHALRPSVNPDELAQPACVILKWTEHECTESSVSRQISGGLGAMLFCARREGASVSANFETSVSWGFQKFIGAHPLIQAAPVLPYEQLHQGTVVVINAGKIEKHVSHRTTRESNFSG